MLGGSAETNLGVFALRSIQGRRRLTSAIVLSAFMIDNDIRCEPGAEFSVSLTLPAPLQQGWHIEAEWFGPIGTAVEARHKCMVYALAVVEGLARLDVTGEVPHRCKSGRYVNVFARVCNAFGETVSTLDALPYLRIDAR
jgi:hypothetical protein